MKNTVPRSIFFGFLSWALPLVSSFIVTPFVVRAVGAREYGLYALITGFISYSFSFSIGRAITKYVVEYISKGEIERARGVISATLLLSLAVGCGGGAILILFANFFVTEVLLFDKESTERAVTAFYLAALTIVMLMLQQVFSAILQALGKFDWFSHLTTILSTILSLGNLILAIADGTAVTLLWWNLAIVVLGCISFYYAARRLFPQISLVAKFERDIFHKVVFFSYGVVGYQISGNLLFVFERSWVTREFGAESLTYYAVPMLLALYLHAFVSSLALVLMPLTSEINSQNRADKLLQIYQFATKYIGLIVTYACVSLIIGSEQFLKLWVGDEFASRSSSVFIFHLVTFGILAITVVAWQINDGLGFPLRNALLILFWLVCGVSLMIVLAPRFGLDGIAVARSIGIGLSAPFFILVTEHHVFGHVQWSFWQKTILPLVLAGALSGLTLFYLLKSFGSNWFQYFASNSMAGVVFGAVLLLTNFITVDERKRLRQFFSKARII